MVFKVEISSHSALGLNHNEDRAGFKFTDSGLWCWIIDGGSSIDPNYHLYDGLSSGEWIAETLSSELALVGDDFADIRKYLACAIKRTRDLFFRQPSTMNWPAWALPVGAITLCHVSNTPGGFLAYGIHLGDCPTFVIDHTAVSSVYERNTSSIETRTDQSPSARKKQMMEGRGRLFRSRKHCVLTLWDECIDAAKYTETFCPADSRLLMVTDGASRIWDT